ncbi:MAG: hypothetical protein ACYCX4_00060 [Bacillota bacterium]
MRNKYLRIAIAIIIFTVIFATRSEILPLPSSAKSSGDLIEIPFPYAESLHGETWRLDKDSPEHYVLRVLYMDKVVAAFPVAYSHTPSGLIITLGGKKYAIMAIDLNNDFESGVVTLRQIN